MTTQDQIDYLIKSLDSQIAAFKKRRKRENNLSVIVRCSIITLGALITILLGVKINPSIQESLSNIALVFGAIISLLSTLESFFNYKDLYIRYTTTYTQLLGLKSDLEFFLAGNIGKVREEKINEFHKRFQNILMETNEFWRQTRMSESKN